MSTVGWSNNNELYSVSDDMTMQKWDINGEPEKDPIMEVEQPVLAMDWLAAAKGQNELLAIGCSDGSFRLVGKSGRVEKSVSEAHATAIISIKWSYEGTLATAGEDGQVKTWSRGGMMRS